MASTAPNQFASPDGRLSFDLERTGVGIHLVRRQRHAFGTTSHAALFGRAHEFDRYLAADPLRFEYVLLFTQLRNAFHALAGQPT